MKMLKRQLPSLLVFTICVAILICIFPQVIFDLNAYLFGGGGDSIKNYFVPSWYANYDQGLTFTGMFYPLTEHVLFPEGPFMGWMIGGLKSLGIPVENNVVGIINFGMFLSYPLAALFLFKILRHYSNSIVWSIIISIIIASLSPQFDRFTGHYSLAYMCIIPMLWWFTIQFIEKEKKIYGIVLLFFLLIIGFVHAYFLAIGTLFISSYALALLWFQRKWDKKYIMAILVAILPLIIYMGFASLTDSVDDRHSRPYGFYRYHADLKSILLPHSGYLYDFLQTIKSFKNQRYEGWAYIGLFGVLFIIFSLTRIVTTKFRKDNSFIKRSTNVHMKAALLASVALLVVAFCPFKLGLEWFVELVKPLRQFRSLGRLAWIFFYVFSIFYGVQMIYLFRDLTTKKKKGLLYVLACSFLLISMFEGYSHLKHTSAQINKYKTANIFNRNQDTFNSILSDNNYSALDFQSILVFPYFNIGNEKIYIDGKDNSLFHACKASFETKLPLSELYSSRSSISQSLQLLSLVSHPYLPKPILNQFPNQKPILLIVSSDKLTDRELEIIHLSELLGSSGNIHLYKLELDDLASQNVTLQQEFLNNVSEWTQHNHTFSTSNKKNFELFYSDSLRPFENGVYSRNDIVIWDDQLPFKIDSITQIEFSFWLKVDDLTSGLHEYFFSSYDEKNEQQIRINLNPKLGTDVYKNWVRLSHVTALDPNTSRIKIEVKGNHITYDSFWIRNISEEVIWYNKETDQMIWNNFPLNAY